MWLLLCTIVPHAAGVLVLAMGQRLRTSSRSAEQRVISLSLDDDSSSSTSSTFVEDAVARAAPSVALVLTGVGNGSACAIQVGGEDFLVTSANLVKDAIGASVDVALPEGMHRRAPSLHRVRTPLRPPRC